MKISLEFYNHAEEELFKNYPNQEILDNLTRTPLEISQDEFLAYMMFTEQKDVNGFQTYEDLKGKIERRLGDIEDYLIFENDSVQTRFIGNKMYGDFTERIGVSLGLCSINQIHGLTEADWKLIPVMRTKAFDYEFPIASDRIQFIQVENKGSTTENNTLKTSSVSQHYSSIKAKKSQILEEESKAGIPRYKNLYYGTIGVLDQEPSRNAKVWLVDPPAFNIEMDPTKYKLLSRLRYYLDAFKNIGVRSKITSSLKNRIEQNSRS